MTPSTTAKSADTGKVPKYIYLDCPVCGRKGFPYSASRYRSMVKAGKEPLTCSKKCGSTLRWQRVREAEA